MMSTPEQTSSAGTAWDSFTAPTERYRRPFRVWRRGRPFYAGLSILLAGLEIYWAPHSSVGKMISMGLPGISSLFIPIFLIIFAVTVWFFPTYRVFSGIAAILLALLSLVATNLGGFFIGFLLGMFGGAFAVAWTPRADYTADTRRQRRRRALAGEFTAEFTAPDGSAETAAEAPAQAQAQAQAIEESAEAAASRQAFADYADTNTTQIIDQATRSDQAAPAGSEPVTEEE
jgi:hypothetical protein